MSQPPNDPAAYDDARAILFIFILAAYRGDITIYDRETCEPYSFRSFRETRDVIYEQRFTLEPPTSAPTSEAAADE